MTDRELLELAAKAAGVEYIVSGGHLWTTLEGSINKWTERWNPLAIDGQALRLAVKLWIEPDFRIGTVRCFGESSCCIEVTEPDPYAATRRAIVRAAAEIGKAMKGGQHVE